jgi:23S rRNA (cytosine1962-C5)-methyltransferase
VLFWENGLHFEADPIRGQKTGLLLDQRDNRVRVEKLATGKTVLNVFAYTGGFSVYAARGGAREIVSVDASRPALEAAIRNMAHNRHIPSVAAASHKTVVQDAFETLSAMRVAKVLCQYCGDLVAEEEGSKKQTNLQRRVVQPLD